MAEHNDIGVHTGASDTATYRPPADYPAEIFATRMGAHYPNGYAIIAQSDEEAMKRFRHELATAGFSGETMVVVPAQVMHDFLSHTLAQAGMLAQMVASELKQSRIFMQMAEQGTSFLFVHMDDDEARDRLVEVGHRLSSPKAVYYQLLAIEELPFSREDFPGPSPYSTNEVLVSKPSR